MELNDFMPSEPNFIDVVALTRITPQVYVENFGSAINSSFFDASNILGTLKMKKLIEFSANFPGQNAIKITDLGNKLLQDLAAKSESEFDRLDMELINQLASGKRSLGDITGAVNIADTDLAMHLYKLSKQGFVAYEIRNGLVSISLTEKGFLRAKEGMPKVEKKNPEPVQAQQQNQEVYAQQHVQYPESSSQIGIQQPKQNQQINAAQPQEQVENKLMVDELQKSAPKTGISPKRIGILVLLIVVIIVLVVLLIKNL
ncbi:MAG: hypothetical protein QXN59_00925 [Candidatus Micrarchaeaceae archaeon]